ASVSAQPTDIAIGSAGGIAGLDEAGRVHGDAGSLTAKALLAYASPDIIRSLPAWIADLSTEGADLRALGFIGNGQSHPLS
ncbi:hypothetical protein, partial [Vibrio parahaemolyticus]|uniref:hypothetical protein n=1 Tax=Vibrio parahaemolyticus TaxID=670 RepID=UPI001A8D2359